MQKFPRYEPERDVDGSLNCNFRDVSSVQFHFHQSIELTYLLRGRVDFAVGDTVYPLEAGQIAYVPGYYAHSASGGVDAQSVVLIIPKRYYEAFARQSDNSIYFFLDDRDKNARIGRLMTELAEEIDGMSELLKSAYAHMILGLIERDYPPAERQRPNNDRMLQVIEYIDAHYTEPLTLEGLAEKFGYSKYYFSRLFNQTFHCNLRAYLGSVRARALHAADGTAKKASIIRDSGFNTPATYYRHKPNE